jgi:hypothetical protein
MRFAPLKFGARWPMCRRSSAVTVHWTLPRAGGAYSRTRRPSAATRCKHVSLTNFSRPPSRARVRIPSAGAINSWRRAPHSPQAKRCSSTYSSSDFMRASRPEDASGSCHPQCSPAIDEWPAEELGDIGATTRELLLVQVGICAKLFEQASALRRRSSPRGGRPVEL